MLLSSHLLMEGKELNEVGSSKLCRRHFAGTPLVQPNHAIYSLILNKRILIVFLSFFFPSAFNFH